MRDVSCRRSARRPQLPQLAGVRRAGAERGPDRDVNLVMIRAYNDWHVDEWCGAHPDRFIPCGIVPLWDADLAAAEVRRLATKGVRAITFSENPAASACRRCTRILGSPLRRLLRRGSGGVLPHRVVVEGHADLDRRARVGADDPVARQHDVHPRRSVVGRPVASLPRPSLLAQRRRHRLDPLPAPAGRSRAEPSPRVDGPPLPGGMRSPSDVFRKHVLCCFIEDRVGVGLFDELELDNIMWESDYPHSDSSWPRAPEPGGDVAGVDADTIGASPTATRCVTSGSTPSRSTRERCTAAALRAEAADVDTVTHVGRAPDESDRAFFQELSTRTLRGRK
ncbi:MAG: amidohydrolase family protein [Acidimicrobiales bacterium]